MGLFKKFIRNVGAVTVGKGTLTNPSYSDTLGFSSVGNSVQDEAQVGRQAIYPEWFFSSKLGQPRQVDTRTIRKLAKSPWVQMVLNTFKKQISSMPWDIVPEDESDGVDYSEKIAKVKDFLMQINGNDQTIDDLNSEIITDIGEIDAGVWNLVYTSGSYDIGEVPIYDAWGKVVGTEVDLRLKPFGQRELAQVKSADGSTFLKQVDIHKNVLRYYQYSFKHPRQNPTPFDKEEILYMMMNPRSYSVYGYSPVQSIQQVLELLIQGTRYNKDIFTNNAIPDLLATLPKLPKEELAKLKRIWNNEYQGKPHQVGFINWPIENIHKLAESNRDLEWLEGQKWYFKLVFAAFGVSPTEAGFFENANKSNDDGQERTTVRNALEPYFKLIERRITQGLITEILQEEKPGICFKYFPKDTAKEKIEFEQDIKKIEMGIMTINEYRSKQGDEDVEWGDEPMKKPGESMNPMGAFGGQDPNQNPNKDPKQFDNQEKALKKAKFEGFMHGRNSNN